MLANPGRVVVPGVTTGEEQPVGTPRAMTLSSRSYADPAGSITLPDVRATPPRPPSRPSAGGAASVEGHTGGIWSTYERRRPSRAAVIALQQVGANDCTGLYRAGKLTLARRATDGRQEGML